MQSTLFQNEDLGPAALKGKEFETLLCERHKQLKSLRIAMVDRCGVKAARMGDQTILHPSYPDFEGVVSRGYQFKYDAKVCSKSSFSLYEYWYPTQEDDKQKPGKLHRQLKHMMERSEFGVKCFFLIHWNARALKTKTVDQATWAFPVHHEMAFWKSFLCLEVRQITREDCERLGKRVYWNTLTDRQRKKLPDLLAALR